MRFSLTSRIAAAFVVSLISLVALATISYRNVAALNRDAEWVVHTYEPLEQNLITASSGTQALRRVLAHDFAVILLDVQMPDMSGIDAAAMIRERERSKTTPIIFLTGVVKTAEMMFKGYSAGAVDYLMKPVISGVLRAKVEVFVELAQVRHSLQQLPYISGDRPLLHQVFLNLLANAVKYTRTRAEARIQVFAVEQDDEVIVGVKDNGVGFDPAYSDKLFGVFQRLHSASDFEGTGVGLANVRRIVQRHGGRTWAESVLNEGATFYFSLPAPVTAECAMPAPDAQKVALPSQSVENEPSGPDDA